MIRFISALLIVPLFFVTGVSASSYDWAQDAVDYCVQNEILNGLENGELALGANITNEQTATILTSAFLEDKLADKDNFVYQGIDQTRWSAPYVYVFNGYTKNPLTDSNLTENTTREEFVSALVLASGLTEGNIRNRDILSANFDDASDVGEKYTTLICIAVERGYMLGSDGKLNPKEDITRAEACSLIYRVIRATVMGETLELGVRQSSTPMIGAAQVSVEQAKKWAESKNASESFINIADVYWQYGELTGIRPEILYAQAAKETGFGRYGGNVLPEQNNWAGIKTAGATGDTTYDHETFATPEDGVRGHFNHIGAYVGIAPIGEPHGRYNSIVNMPWAGTVKTLEELGGKWCPDLYYGYSILHNLLEPMMNTIV